MPEHILKLPKQVTTHPSCHFERRRSEKSTQAAVCKELSQGFLGKKRLEMTWLSSYPNRRIVDDDSGKIRLTRAGISGGCKPGRHFVVHFPDPTGAELFAKQVIPQFR